MHYICKECGKKFEITEGEAEFFRNKGLDLPKRCKECRAAKKQTEPVNEIRKTVGITKDTDDIDTGSRKKGAKPLLIKIITAAAVLAVLLFAGVKLFTPVELDLPTANDYEVLYSDFSADEETDTAQTAVEVTDITAAETESKTTSTTKSESTGKKYTFANDTLLTQHYEKHGIEMGFSSKEAYEAAASAVVTNPASLHKTEAEDGDDVYYLEATNEFVIVSTYGYIRTYFKPSSGKAYYDRQ